jgi:hypothetical protein
MVLKFKVWRLQREWHIVKGGKRQVLVLRDKAGHIRKIAKNPFEEFTITKWYQKYNIDARLEQLLAVRRLKEHIRNIKANVAKRGFTFQLSFYGITKNVKTEKRVYRRYEVFKAEKWKQLEVAAMHKLFKEHPPRSQAGVFIFHNRKLFVVGSDEVTQFGTQRVGYKGERRTAGIG